MENFFTRYKNPLVLMAVLFIQVIALATQVKRLDARGGNTGAGGSRLIRVWTVTAFAPFQKVLVSTGRFFRDGWHNYADLRGVRRQNEQLQQEISGLRMEQVRLRQDADQAHRLQALLKFKEKFVAKTLVAQVIATSGTEQSHVITIDKGSRDGVKPDMAVITPDGIVGKVKEITGPFSSQVLLINDHDSGAGVILESSRLQGVLKGTGFGELQVIDIMSDEQVNAGEHVITSGGDKIFPKGLSVGTVISASQDRDNDSSLTIRVKPSADLRRLEEVLVVTEIAEETPAAAEGSTPLRAADILSERLPSVPKPTPSPTPKTNQPGSAAAGQKKPGASATGSAKPPSASNEAGTAKPGTPAGKPAAAGTTSSATPNKGAETKKPASSTGQQNSSSAGAGTAPANGAASPTPTPKPKPPAKKKTPAAPDASQTAPENKQPAQPEPTPSPSPEGSR
jgi:rod shape-determining protein MreC